MNLLAVCALVWAVASPSIPAAAQSVVRDLPLDGEGHSDVAWFDFFYVVEEHWVRLTGTAVLRTPCGDRELEFQFEASGRENFSVDTYTYQVDLPDGHFVLTDPLADGDLIIEAAASTTLRCRYPRPIGPAVWTLFGEWSSSSRREFLEDCGWSASTDEASSGLFWLRPSFGDSDDLGVTLTASGQMLGAIGTPVPVSTSRSWGTMKAAFRD